MDFIKDFNIIAEDVVYNQAKLQTDLEARIYDVLSNKNWSPSSTMLDELAQDTYDYEKYPIIMKSLWDGMNNHPAAWRIVFKSLILLEHLIKHGNERCVDEAQGNKHFLRGLLHFNNFEGTVDRGINVREKSKQIAELLSDNERILEERQKAKRLRENLAVLSQGSGGSFISSMMNSSHSSSSSYTGYLKNEYTGPTYSGYVKDVRYSDRNSSLTNSSTVLNVSNSFEDPSSKSSKLINQQAKVIKNTNKKKKKESCETSAAGAATSSDLTSLSDDMMFSSFDDGSIAPPTICTPVPASVENNRNNVATLPQRKGEPDCRDYLRTGRCKYGETCKYHHPPNVQSGGGIASIDPSEPPFPIRPGEPACQYFLKHGTCKFGQTCKFNHPPNFKARLPEQHHLSPQQQHSMPHQGRLPQRPGEPDCIYFLRNGRCKYGFTCKYHHPLRNMRRSASLGSDPRTAGNTQYILLDPSNLVMINKDGSHTKFTTTAAAQAQVQLQGHHPQQGFFPHTTSSPVLVSTSALNGASPLLTSTTSLASSYDASTLSTLGGGNVSTAGTTPGGGGESYPSWQQQQRRSRINSVSSALSMEEYLQRGPPPPLTSVYHQQQTQHHPQQQQTQNNSESGSSSLRESLSGSSLKDLSGGGGQVPPPSVTTSAATSEKYDEGLSEMTSALLNILDHDDEGGGEKGKMVNNLNSSSPTSNNNNTDNTNNNPQQQQQQQGLLRQNLDSMNIMINDSTNNLNSSDILLSAGSNSYIGPRSLPSTLSNIGSYQKTAGTGGGILMNDPPMLPPNYSPSSYSYHHGNFLSKNTTNTATGISVGSSVGGSGGIGDLIQQQHSQHAPQKMHQRSLLSSVMEEQQQQQQQHSHNNNTHATTNTAATAAAQNWSPSSWQPSSSLPNTFFPRL